jgi:hypothetical protein
MAETEMPKKGPFEGSSRVLRELLRTPSFKKSVNLVLNDLDPENAGLLAQTLVWQDVEFFLSLFSSLPILLNILVRFLVELLRQLGNFTPELISSFMASIIDDLEADSLGAGVGLTLMLLLDMGATDSEDLKAAAPNFVQRFSRGLAGALEGEAAEGQSAGSLMVDKVVPVLSNMASKMGESAASKDSQMSALVTSVTNGIDKVASENPQFIQSVVNPLVDSWRRAVEGEGQKKKTKGADN